LSRRALIPTPDFEDFLDFEDFDDFVDFVDFADFLDFEDFEDFLDFDKEAADSSSTEWLLLFDEAEQSPHK
jgi:hypothetical protein